MADEKNQKPTRPAEDKAAKEAQAKAQREAAEAQKAKERAQKEAQAKAQREAAEAQKAKDRAQKEAADAQKAKERAQKEAQAKVQREAAEAQKAKDRAQKEAADAQRAKERAQKEAQAKAQKEAADAQKAKDKAQKEAQAKAQKEAAAAQKAAKKQGGNAEQKPEKPEKPAGKDGKKEKPQKMTRKEKKELLKKQLEREKELVEAGEIPLRNKYKPRGLFWRIFGVSLAFFMGIFAALGGVVGAGAILLGGPSRDLLAQFGFEAEQYISADYLDKSVFEMYDEIVADMNRLSGSPGDLTLNDFSKYTPLIDTYIDQLVKQNLEELGVKLDLADIKDQPFGQIGSYVKKDLLPQIELGPVLGLDKDVTPESIKSNAPMYALSYGKLGVHYTIGETQDENGNTTKTIVMLGDNKPKNITDLIPALKEDDDLSPQPTSAEEGGEESGSEENGMLDILGDIDLGSFLGIDIKLDSETGEGDSSMVYTLCYGTENEDYTFEQLKDDKGNPIAGCYYLKMKGESKATSVNTLIDESTDFVKGLPLGEMLGLNTADKVADMDSNSMMYALCYGTEGEDYEINESGLIEMLPGHAATTLGDLTDESTNFINGLYIDSLLGIKPGSDSILRTIAYGNEMKKGEDGNYLKDENGKYMLDPEPTADGKKQYMGGGKYVIENDKIVMLPDPNDATGKLYSKKTIGDLTKEDASLLDGITLGSILNVTSDSSQIMQTLADWTLDDLKDKDKIESLTIGDLLDPSDATSPLIHAMEDWTLADIKKKEKIESLKIKDVLDTSDASGILKAMENWAIGDLGNQNRIERLKIGQILKSESDQGILHAMQDWRISDLSSQEKIDSLTLGDVISIGDGAPKMLQALKEMSLGEITTSIDTLTLGDVIDLSADNKILNSIKNTQIKSIGSAIDSLTVEDVFGDDIWSYAETVPSDAKPTGIVSDKSSVTKYYRLKTANTRVTEGWYTGSAGSYTPVNESKVLKTFEGGAIKYVTKVKVTVTKEETKYYIYDYDNPTHQVPYNGNVEQDADKNFYYTDEDGNRVDLEAYPAVYKLNGADLPKDAHVYDNGTGAPYYTEYAEVHHLFVEGSHYHELSEVEVAYEKSGSGTQLTAYHAGVWYLLLTKEDGTDGATTKITEMGSLVTDVAGKINNLTLNEMYIHEIIQSQPNVDLTPIKTIIEAAGGRYPFGEDKMNLSDLTINEVITLISAIGSH